MSNVQIPYVEIRDLNTRNILGIIEGAEIFFEYAYREAGDFEIYCRSTPNSRRLLVKDNLVTLPSSANETEDNVWIINKIEKTNDSTGGRFLVATGKEAKTLVDRRIIHCTTVLNAGKSLVTEVRDKLFEPNAISPKDEKRKLDGFVFGASTVDTTITETTQVTWDNLYEYTETLYIQYVCAAKLRIDKTAGKLIYTIYKGEDKSGRVVFSQANENLLSSDYIADYTNFKTSVFVGGEDPSEEGGVALEDEELKIDVSGSTLRTVYELPSVETGYDRREVFIDARDLQREYEDENGDKQTMSEEEYEAALKQRGLEKKADEHSAEVTFTGDIDQTSQRYKFGRDYGLGDIVTNRDEDEKKGIPVRVLKFVKVQNSEGYKEYFESEEAGNVE